MSLSALIWQLLSLHHTCLSFPKKQGMVFVKTIEQLFVLFKRFAVFDLVKVKVARKQQIFFSVL